MMIRCVLIVWCLVTYTHVWGQNQGTYINNRYIIERVAGASPMSATIPGIPMVIPTTVVGNAFLNDNFCQATFLLENDKTTNAYFSKYDLQRNQFYLLASDSGTAIYTVRGDEVKNFYWTDSLTMRVENFINAKYVKTEGAPFVGFFQVLSVGPVPLLKRTELILQPPDYNIVLNVGRKEFRFLKKDHLYYVSDGIAKPLPAPKKIPRLFENHQESMQKFMKINDINLADEWHVIAFFDYFNNKPPDKN
jgi:hypothetical protein